MDIKNIDYRGMKNSYSINNGFIELIIITDMGPRIISFNFLNDENVFKVFDENFNSNDNNMWRIMGGHRLWHSPEDLLRTYYPDNEPVKFIKENKDTIKLEQNKETTTNLQKEIQIRFINDNSVEIKHRIINRGLWDIKLSAWALSIMREGGKAIIPLPPKLKHTESILPATSISLWSYTDMSDERWYWGSKFITLKQITHQKSSPQKIGLLSKDSWLAYVNNNNMFVKTYDFFDDSEYPDYGCSSEIFTDMNILELETLSPLINIKPGDFIEHTEKWYLFKNVKEPLLEKDIENHILPLIKNIIN